MKDNILIKKDKKPLRKTLINNLVKLYVKGYDYVKEEFLEKYDLHFISALYIYPANNSCGIREISGIQDQFDEIFTNSKIKLSKEEFELFFKTLENDFMNLIKEYEAEFGSNGVFYTVSLNKGSHKSLIQMFDNIATYTTDWSKNPNTGNLIKLWVIKMK